MSGNILKKGDGIRGFTLIEIMLALFILSVGLLALAKMQISTIQGNAFGGRMTTAVFLAQYQMEFLMNTDLEAAGEVFDPNGGTPWPAAGVSSKQGPTIETLTVMDKTYTGYNVEWYVTANSPEDDLVTFEVQVARPNGTTPITLVTTKRR